MSKEVEALDALIEGLPQARRLEVKTLALKLSDWLARHGANGMLAFAIIGGKLQDDMDREDP